MTSQKNYIEVRLGQDAHPGERYVLQIGSEKQNQKIVIPVSAVITKYSTPGVYIYANKTAQFRIITLHESDDRFVAVDGLKV
jgi:hypothetical protein